jgi:predicted Holliday junction resolvase-like endonuclease
MRNEPPPVAQVGYDASRVEEYSARRYCPSDEDHDDDRSTLLGSASTNCNSRIKVPGKSYDTFPNTTESRKGKPKSWVSVVELFVVLFFFLVLLQPVISAFVRFVDPHEGVESREHRLEHKQWEAERKQEEQRRADERAKWAEEEEQMSARRRSRLDEWEEDRKMEMELRRRDREEWNRQRAAELEQRNKERQEWEEMKKDMDGWRYRHSGAVWTKPVAEKCAAYGIRTYWHPYYEILHI